MEPLNTQFRELVHDFEDVADFLIIYVAEAHPTDGWRVKVIGNSPVSKRHLMQSLSYEN